MRGLLVLDHLDNRSEHRRGGHLSGLTRPGGSPLVGAPLWAGSSIQLVEHSDVAKWALGPELVSLGAVRPEVGGSGTPICSSTALTVR